jgi:mRNA-degrading endonuclease RelE of RelBE toxin-antitoxin system
MKVRLAPQVADFIRRLAPEPRRRLRQALRDLEKGKGDIKALEGPLQDYCRLRVGEYRVVLSYGPSRTVDCVFAERRSLVYEVFADAMIERLMRERVPRS